MSEFLFQRRCALSIAAPHPGTNNFVELDRLSPRRFEGLRFQFKIKKTLKKEPNTAEISVWNLAPDSRALLQAKGAKFQLEAGYAEEAADLVSLNAPVFGIIFSGDVRFADNTRDGPNWVSKIRAGDGERAFGYGRVNQVLAPPGGRIVDVVVKLAKVFSRDVSDSIERIAHLQDQFPKGYAASGRAADELDNILVSRGYEWSIQDGRFQILGSGEALPDVTILLTPSSGLIGSPEHGTPEKKDGQSLIKVKSLLRPTFRPGGKVEVRASGMTGQLRIETVEHVGDTHGGDWYSNLECSQIQTVDRRQN